MSVLWTVMKNIKGPSLDGGKSECDRVAVGENYLFFKKKIRAQPNGSR